MDWCCCSNAAAAGKIFAYQRSSGRRALLRKAAVAGTSVADYTTITHQRSLGGVSTRGRNSSCCLLLERDLRDCEGLARALNGPPLGEPMSLLVISLAFCLMVLHLRASGTRLLSDLVMKRKVRIDKYTAAARKHAAAACCCVSVDRLNVSALK